MKHIILIAIAALMLTGVLFSQPNMVRNPQTQPGMGTNDNPKLKERLAVDEPGNGPMLELGLSEAQKTKIEELRLSHQKQMNTLEAEIENLEMDMQQAMNKEDFANARKLTKQLNDKRLVVANARIDHMEAMLKQLTPEQREKAKGMFMHQPGMGMGMGRNMHQGKGKGMGMENCQGDCMDKMQPSHMRQMNQAHDCMQGQTMMKDAEGNCPDCQGHQNMDKQQPGATAPQAETKK